MASPEFNAAHQAVIQLVKNFADNLSQHHSPEYNESRVRKDYIDKFFTLLGWDVNHDYQTNPYEQEVKVERNVSVAARVKKADYAFFIGPNFAQERFFVEAKRPSASLDNPDAIFQTIRYAFSSSKAALSVLTNFEWFYVIDCRYRPDIETAANHVHKKFYFTDFYDVTKFGEVFYLFGRDEVAGGSLERYAETLPKPKGKVVQRRLFGTSYQEVDESFLVQLEGYRLDLAKMFKRKNTDLDGESLTEAVQRTIDRLIFIRFLEDKLIEPSTILDKFGDKPNAWKQFILKSREFDKTYNGIIFKDHPVIDRPDFEVDDRVFLDICDSLADKYSPYHFNYIPIHILGSIYERFLGSVIATTAKRATVEQKPEVRKAGGVFYTPQYIVKYIVENTVGELVKGKTPEQVSEMRFADIACGSGSFLLGVYEYLLGWHTKYYNETAKKKEAKEAGCITNDDGTFALSFEQKKEILVNNIYGVDIDRQAYEVTQLSLFLKLLEDETQGTAKQFLTGHRESLLPDLRNNIVCGNALVDWDISSGDLLEQVDQEKEKRLNPMSFEQKFPAIMSNGGFDAIVGNPPYGMIADPDEKEYFSSKFATVEGRFDNYELFIEGAMSRYRAGGFLGYIVPSPILTNLYVRKLRNYLIEKSTIIQIANFGMEVFDDPTVHTCILILQNRIKRDNRVAVRRKVLNIDELELPFDYQIAQSDFSLNPNSTFDIFVDPKANAVLKKLNLGSIPLKDVCHIRQCIKTGNDSVYVVKSEHQPGPEWKRTLRGRSIGRYETTESDVWLRYGNWLARNWANKSFYETPKIAIRETGKTLVANLDLEHRYFLSSLYAVYPIVEDKKLSLLYLLAILNSKLAMYFLRLVALELTDGAFTKFRTNQIGRLPIKVPDSVNEPSEKLQHDLIVRSVEQIMKAKQKLAAATTERDRDFWQGKCDVLERTIDEAVYKLYDLTPEEIAIVEGGN